MWSLMSRPRSRSASNSGRPARAAPRLAASPGATLASARCSCVSPSAARALSLKAGDVDFMGVIGALADRRIAELAGQHLGHVAHGDFAALAGQLARHVHQAAEVAGQQHVGAGRRDLLRLALDDGVGDLGILDRERAAEAAAHLRIGQLDQLQALDRAQKPARLLADAELAQARAAVVIGGAGLRARHRRP